MDKTTLSPIEWAVKDAAEVRALHEKMDGVPLEERGYPSYKTDPLIERINYLYDDIGSHVWNHLEELVNGYKLYLKWKSSTKAELMGTLGVLAWYLADDYESWTVHSDINRRKAFEFLEKIMPEHPTIIAIKKQMAEEGTE